jgi:hypothetical protein
MLYIESFCKKRGARVSKVINTATAALQYQSAIPAGPPAEHAERP